jgi:hypothetical protein
VPMLKIGTSIEEMFVVFSLLALFFFITNCAAVYETITNPLTEADYDWGVKSSSILWTVMVPILNYNGNCIRDVYMLSAMDF